MPTLNITFTPDQIELIRTTVANRRFASAAEYVRHAVMSDLAPNPIQRRIDKTTQAIFVELDNLVKEFLFRTIKPQGEEEKKLAMANTKAAYEVFRRRVAEGIYEAEKTNHTGPGRRRQDHSAETMVDGGSSGSDEFQLEPSSEDGSRAARGAA